MMEAPWPSQQQRGYVEMLARYHPSVFAAWRTRLERALAHKQLDKRSEEVLVAAVQAVCHFGYPIIEHHIDEAFNAGSNVAELMEAMIRAGEQEGTHALSSGGNALWNVVQRREAAGLPTPHRGRPLGPEDLIPHSPWLPAIFPYQTPWPRPWGQALAKFEPERTAINARASAERAKLPPQLSRRMKELLDVAMNVAVSWRGSDHHMHEALYCGSNVQEMVELIMVCAEAAQGGRESYVAGRSVESGVQMIRLALHLLGEVLAERDAAGVFTPREYGEGAKSQPWMAQAKGTA